MQTDALVRTSRLPRIQLEIESGGFSEDVILIARDGGWSVVRCRNAGDARKAGLIGS